MLASIGHPCKWTPVSRGRGRNEVSPSAPKPHPCTAPCIACTTSAICLCHQITKLSQLCHTPPPPLCQCTNGPPSPLPRGHSTLTTAPCKVSGSRSEGPRLGVDPRNTSRVRKQSPERRPPLGRLQRVGGKPRPRLDGTTGDPA